MGKTHTQAITDELVHCTTRIESHYDKGKLGYGTGFFYQYGDDAGGKIPVLVTNKHVIRDSNEVHIQLTLRNPDGTPRFGDFRTIIIDGETAKWIMHPDADVDLCIFPIAPIVNYAIGRQEPFFFTAFEKDLMPTKEKLESCAFLEDVVMIGYPIGLWDEANNLPLIRKGITATHAKFDYNNRKELMVDLACFPGSSGSPVFILREGSFLDHMHGINDLPFTLMFLGVFYAYPQYSTKGEIVPKEIPTSTPSKDIAVSAIPTNLGYVIKAERLLEFDPIVKSML